MILKSVFERIEDKNKIKHIYVSSFPAYERMPFFMLLNSAKKNDFELLGIYEDSNLVGFFYDIIQNDICLILYFAIDEQNRSCGYGSEALKLIKQYYPNKRIFLYIEGLDVSAKNYKQQIMRKKFYLRNGFHPANYNIMLSNNKFEVLLFGESILEAEYIRAPLKTT
jgi:hypothetical protein